MVSEKMELPSVGTITAMVRDRFEARLPAVRLGT